MVTRLESSLTSPKVSPKSQYCLQIKAQAEAEGKLLPQYHPAVQRVEGIAKRIIQSALQGKGGGYQEHMKVHAASNPTSISMMSFS